jgi:hypothetical protein
VSVVQDGRVQARTPIDKGCAGEISRAVSA